MEELGEFDESYKISQEKIRERQNEFENQQREYMKHSAAIDAAEKRKNMIINWSVIGLTFIFIMFLVWKLLF